MTWVPVRVGCLVFLNNRYYDPTTGFFLSVDPLVATTGQPYLYANGNPTTLSDPSGPGVSCRCGSVGVLVVACVRPQVGPRDGQSGS